MTTTHEEVSVGYSLPEHVSPEITRHVLALFCGASGDHNPMHVDTDFAKSFGMQDVFAQGMLSMAYLAQLLTNWVPQRQIREYGARFTAITPLHARVHCRGEVVEIFEKAGERLARLRIGAWTDTGLQTLDGEAVVAIT